MDLAAFISVGMNAVCVCIVLPAELRMSEWKLMGRSGEHLINVCKIVVHHNFLVVKL